MRRFSSSVVSSARVTCSSHVFPTMVTTGALLASRSAKPWSSAAATPFLQVEPNAATCACLSGMVRTRWKKAMSLGFDAGKPPSTEVDAELVEPPDDAQLVLQRQRHAFALLSVPQRAVVGEDSIASSMHPFRSVEQVRRLLESRPEPLDFGATDSPA